MSSNMPEWLTEEGLKTLKSGYLLEGESPRDMYVRVAKAAASYFADSEKLAERFFEYLWKGWLNLATPVAANMGTNRGLPISCFSSYMEDNLVEDGGIFETIKEVAAMTKYGGGTSVHMNAIRSTKERVNGTGGYSSGPVSWAKILDSTILAVSQGNVRRGSVAIYLPVEHPDIESFLNIRNPTQDRNFYCPNIHHGICLTNSWMEEMLNGDVKKREIWKKILELRFKTGEPYLFFTDHAQKNNPPGLNWYKVNGSNLCTEIMLHTDKEHSLVCCLSSLNLSKYDEWKDTDLPYWAIWFLDGVMQEFIEKTKNVPALKRARNFAIKSRALGLGVLGWHTLLQKNMVAFDSFEAMLLNAKIFKFINEQAIQASKDLAKMYGPSEWAAGLNQRNTHLLAVAPTVSNSTIAGGVSPGIEPIAANVFVQKSAKGVFIRYNKQLKDWLASVNLDNENIWKKIIQNDGSVSGLKEIPKEIQEVFLTAREINQFSIVKQAAQRQKWIDQGQSVNLFFMANSDPKYVHNVHIEAWKGGLKSLYYLRSSSAGKADFASRSAEECKSCEG